MPAMDVIHSFYIDTQVKESLNRPNMVHKRSPDLEKPRERVGQGISYLLQIYTCHHIIQPLLKTGWCFRLPFSQDNPPRYHHAKRQGPLLIWWKWQRGFWTAQNGQKPIRVKRPIVYLTVSTKYSTPKGSEFGAMPKEMGKSPIAHLAPITGGRYRWENSI